MLYRGVTIFVLLLSIYAYIWRQQYISELFVSFLPYILAFFWLALCFWLLVFFLRIKRRKTKILIIESMFWVFCSVFFVFLGGRIVGNFYEKPTSTSSHCEQGVSVLFANVYRKNSHYKAIQDLVDTYDPDILLFVEFSEHQSEVLGDYLSSRYPHINRAVWSRERMVGSLVFSKIPINDLSSTFDQGAWRYGYFSMDIDNELYYFYLLHTSSPISSYFWEMRNTQLATFVDDYHEHALYRLATNVVVVGDFNTSPWSVTYSAFMDDLGGVLSNITASRGVIFTWFFRLRGIDFTFLRSHIDHIFSTRPDRTVFHEAIPLSGSDHSALFFSVGCKP